ncbi:MAG: hypothetical protein AB7G17_11970 [Phycisphaerales bacterium]
MFGDAAIPHPSLRLTRRPLRVEHDAPSGPDAWKREAQARLAIADENTSASAVDVDDARRLLATRVAECLEGGRSAILTPMRRKRVLRLAHMLGVRDFDAHLVIAIVQESARRGETAESAADDPRIDLLPRPVMMERPRKRVAVAVALGTGLLLALLGWFFGV